MTEHPQGRRRRRANLWLALTALAVLLALLFVPPFISVKRYQNRITQVVSASIGRPVRLSSVELRILPQPSFVLTDLVVEEDPAYGAEPVLHANTVTASIRMLPLWLRGKLEISRISVDEASLNLVRTNEGHWNLDAFFRTAAARAGSGTTDRRAMPFPYLEATNSRVNIKNSVEKLPYSLVNADLSFWQESPGDWRVRLRGQPARTDVSFDLADTGIVRLEADLRRSTELRKMPIHVDLDWRQAQLGQLSRLLVGSDEGWRGDLAGEVHVEGTADAAQVRTRLRASGVHRAEFAPASPIDFDASCAFVYHYSNRGVENVMCDSPVGNGRVRLTGEVPGAAPPRLTLELDRVPAQIGLDTLRTLRRGIDPSLQASGGMSGKISYAPGDVASGAPPPGRAANANPKAAKTRGPAPGPLTGIISVANLHVSVDGLSKPIVVQRATIEPAPGQPPALAATVAISAGASAPLNLTARLSLAGYQLGIHGPAALPRLREWAHGAGVAHASLLEKLDGPPAAIDLNADGPWLPSLPPLPQETASGTPVKLPPASALVAGASDRMSGTITLHAASWKPDFLASPLEISSATLHMDDSGGRWDPVAFAFGPVKGTATLKFPFSCDEAGKCAPQFSIQFASLDAAVLQAAILGVRQSDTLLSGLLARFRPSSSPAWPELEGVIRADSLILGPATLSSATASVHIHADGADVTAFDAALFGGRIHTEGALIPGDKPDYKLSGHFDHVSAAGLGRLLGMSWSGNALDGTGQIELAGFTEKDLSTSAKGLLHFNWPHGSIAEAPDIEAPPELARFDRWTAEAEIVDGAITLKQNQVQRGTRKIAVEASATFGEPPQVTFGISPDTRAARK